MRAIEIKYDKKTLPKDGQKIKYRTMDTGEWLKGKYVASDHMFRTNSRVWHFVNNVDVWKPRKRKKK